MSVQLSKGQEVRLSKRPSGVAEIILNWRGNVDGDLAAMYELSNGRTGVIQALDRTFGSLDTPPFVHLHGDSRTGGSEQMDVGLTRPEQVKRIVVFAFIYPYDAAGNLRNDTWSDAGDAHVIVRHPAMDELVFRLDSAPHGTRSMTLLDFQVDSDGTLVMTPLGDFFTGFHQEIDSHYGWPASTGRRAASSLSRP